MDITPFGYLHLFGRYSPFIGSVIIENIAISKTLTKRTFGKLIKVDAAYGISAAGLTVRFSRPALGCG